MKLASAVTGAALATLMAYGAFGADPAPPVARPPEVVLRLTPPEANLLFQALQQAPLQWKDSNPLILKLEQAYREATMPQAPATSAKPVPAAPAAKPKTWPFGKEFK